MLRYKISLIVVLTLTTLASAQEKIIFGKPSPISSSGTAAEARSTGGLVVLNSSHQTQDQTQSSGSPRKSRVFSFPSANGQSESGRTRSSYVLAAPSIGHSAYEVPSNEYELPRQPTSESLSDESRLLSLLPSLGGGNGMQVGLDFKLPFFSIPYAKLLSGLTAPIIGGGSFFESNAYGSSPGATGNALGSSFFGSESGLTSSLATMAAMAVTAALLYPKITSVFSPIGGKGVFRNANNPDDFMQNLNSVLGQFNIDGESCMKVALCSLGNVKIQRPKRARDASSNTTPSDIIEDLLNLPSVKQSLSKGGLGQARDFGGSGGDCDYFNRENKCPVASETFQKMFSNFV